MSVLQSILKFDDRAIIIETENKIRSVIIADLHLGLHIELEMEYGVSVPSEHQTMLDRVKQLISRYKARILYVLGDIKHSIGIEQDYYWQTIPRFFEELGKMLEVVVLPGNHDGAIEPLLPRNIVVEDKRGVVIPTPWGSIGLMHGHSWPSEKVLSAQLILMGHNHPSIKIVTRGIRLSGIRPQKTSFVSVFVKTKLDKNCVRRFLGCNEQDNDRWGDVIILPSFSKFPLGVNVNTPTVNLQGPIFKQGCAISNDYEIYSPDGIFIGMKKGLYQI